MASEGHWHNGAKSCRATETIEHPCDVALRTHILDGHEDDIAEVLSKYQLNQVSDEQPWAIYSQALAIQERQDFRPWVLKWTAELSSTPCACIATIVFAVSFAALVHASASTLGEHDHK